MLSGAGIFTYKTEPFVFVGRYSSTTLFASGHGVPQHIQRFYPSSLEVSLAAWWQVSRPEAEFCCGTPCLFLMGVMGISWLCTFWEFHIAIENGRTWQLIYLVIKDCYFPWLAGLPEGIVPYRPYTTSCNQHRLIEQNQDHPTCDRKGRKEVIERKGESLFLGKKGTMEILSFR